MVPIPAEYLPDFWDQIATECSIEVTCLLPNGVILLLNVNYNATLSEIKEDLWEEAAKFPLYGKLHDMSVYTFTYINSMAEREKLHDESRRIGDIRPTGAVLVITECREEKADESVNITIGQLIGKRLQEFDALNNTEINDFRFKMRKMGDEMTQRRSKQTWQERMFYQFPPRILTNSHILNEIKNGNGCIKIASKFDHEYDYCESENRFNEKEVMQSSFTFNVPLTIRPRKLLEMILFKRATILNRRNDRPSEYILKVCGQDEFLVGDFEIIQFQYIQDCISKDITPTLVTIHIDRVPVFQSNDYESLDICENKKGKQLPYNTSNTLRKKKNIKSSWTVNENYVVDVCTVSKLNCDTRKFTEVGIQAGIFHGGKSLCQSQRAFDNPIDDKYESKIGVTLNFDIQVCNIPRNAKLCFVVFEVSKPAKGTKPRKIKDISKDIVNPIAWANTSIYDFKGQLKSGAMTLYMWAYVEDMNSEEILQQLGTVANNPNTEYSTTITININSYSKDQTILFPSVDSMISYAEGVERDLYGDYPDIQMCKKLISEMDSLYEAHDQDRKNIWGLKSYWRENDPEVLPKLLHCVDWDKKEDVSQAVVLFLKDWPKLPVEKSLELLDYAYADQEVRSFAVQCLTNVRHLKIHQPPLDKTPIEHAEQLHLTAKSYVDLPRDLPPVATSVVRSLYRRGEVGIRMDKCRIMDSKMRPLWIVFENCDAYGDDVYIIFKNGDDLRQDILTLQMLRIMDRLWKREGLDLRMNPYGCISSLENRVGMIEVVLNAETIANIQKEKGMFTATAAFRKGPILATYVLGIADRHSDNIMVKKNGQLFHIDFGHILGHFKEKFGFRRERVPFAFMIPKKAWEFAYIALSHDDINRTA
ncbi:hypothetical protein NQ317_016025 [Molorchus minor]|uniref:Uncharacterized protein n=1 Tax=Molorchus minor TaxID=1323400 RepID=A0ABQ9JSB6_9CUCU|nr:hypothetical protein NQ317_016025 [Molorchus minor]